MLANGKAVPAQAIRQALAPLVDFAAQNEHMRLADPAYQLELLDAYGKLDKDAYDKLIKENSKQADDATISANKWASKVKKDGKLAISKTPNGENPLVAGAAPLLGVDVWEHSYYIDYRNLRQKYLEAFFDNLVNWEFVAELYAKAK